MGLFNFRKKDKEPKVTHEEEVKSEVIETKKEEKTFSFLCINLDMDEYSFIVKLNPDGKIIVTKDMDKEEIDDPDKVSEIKDLIENNINKLKELVTRVSPGAKKDNMIQVEYGKDKYVLFRNEGNNDLSLFYDMIIHDVTKILNINKSYSSVKNNLSFEYPNHFEKIPTDDLEKYCLLGNSEPLIMLNDASGDIATFEIVKNRDGFASNMMDAIASSEEYEKLTTMDLSTPDFDIATIIVNYKDNNKVEAINFITFASKCVIFTFMVGDKDKVDIGNLLKNDKILEMMEIMNSFKFLDEDALNS